MSRARDKRLVIIIEARAYIDVSDQKSLREGLMAEDDLHLGVAPF